MIDETLAPIYPLRHLRVLADVANERERAGESGRRLWAFLTGNTPNGLGWETPFALVDPLGFKEKRPLLGILTNIGSSVMSLSPSDFRDILLQEKRHFSFARLEEDYGVNRYYLWNIAKKPDYVPPPHIQEKLYRCIYKLAVACENCQEVHTLGACPDKTPVTVTVFDVSPEKMEELKASGQMLTVIHKKPSKPRSEKVTQTFRVGKITAEERAAILALTPAERKAVLLAAANGKGKV